MNATLTFAPLAKFGALDAEACVWANLEFFLDEHGFSMPRGCYDQRIGRYADPVVEVATEDATHFVYRCDGTTLLRVEWDTCCGEPGHAHQIKAVEVRRA